MADSDLSKDRIIAEKLPLAWPAFFESFGRLTRVQRQAIPSILPGKDVLICSPTASGKTEAVCAPLIERFSQLRASWSILYICPTRALVNDLYYRLQIPLDRMGITLLRRTGDHRDNVMITDNAQHRVIITTPESFDSLMCRGRNPNGDGHALSDVVAIVLDEIHLLAGTARGEQVRWLIERLRRLKVQAVKEGWTRNPELQVIGLSATVERPEKVLNEFIMQGQLITVPGQRNIEAEGDSMVPCPFPKTLISYLKSSERSEKILVFCNARKRVDQLAYQLADSLRPLGYSVIAHHGSLSRKMREAAEDAVRTESRIVMCATSTMEIGVDIGDIDLVVLDGPAPDVPALLQRIGRGNRRSGITRVMICSYNYAEMITQKAMIAAAKEGFLGIGENGPQYAVIMQQIASYIFQGPKRDRSRKLIMNLLNKLVPSDIAVNVLDEMISNGELLEDTAGIRLSDEWLDKTNSGKIHSNIESQLGAQVYDELSGAEIAAGVVYNGGKSLNIGGHNLQVKKHNARRIETVKNSTHYEEGRFRYAGRSFFEGAGQAQAVQHYLKIPDHQWPVIDCIDQTFVFHFGGSKRRAIIELIISNIGKDASKVKVNNWYVVLPGHIKKKPEWFGQVGSGVINLEISDKLNSLERILARPASNKKLPIQVRVNEVREWLNIEEELETIRQAVWKWDNDSNVEATLLHYIDI